MQMHWNGGLPRFSAISKEAKQLLANARENITTENDSPDMTFRHIAGQRLKLATLVSGWDALEQYEKAVKGDFPLTLRLNGNTDNFEPGVKKDEDLNAAQKIFLKLAPSSMVQALSNAYGQDKGWEGHRTIAVSPREAIGIIQEALIRKLDNTRAMAHQAIKDADSGAATRFMTRLKTLADKLVQLIDARGHIQLQSDSPVVKALDFAYRDGHALQKESDELTPKAEKKPGKDKKADKAETAKKKKKA